MSADDAGLFVEHLGEAECWRLLSSSSVGRIGVLHDSAPEIYPMNFAVMDHSILFRTDAGNKLTGIERSPAVCFEIDEMQPDLRTGWSVLVKGRASELVTQDELEHAASFPLELWSIGDKSHWFRIHPTEVTGRRIQRITHGGER